MLSGTPSKRYVGLLFTKFTAIGMAASTLLFQSFNSQESIAAIGNSKTMLNANNVLRSLERLPIDDINLLIIENVGNLVCPAGIDLGEHEKIVLMSVTEGEDKPTKYPLAFSSASTLVLV